MTKCCNCKREALEAIRVGAPPDQAYPGQLHLQWTRRPSLDPTLGSVHPGQALDPGRLRLQRTRGGNFLENSLAVRRMVFVKGNLTKGRWEWTIF